MFYNLLNGSLSIDAKRLINTDHFPIFEERENRAALVKQIQEDLAEDGHIGTEQAILRAGAAYS